MSETHANRAYEHLRSKLLAGELAPGTRLRYGPLGKELGISATPVREAMGLLASEGFIELIPQLGAVVRRLDRAEALELYEWREGLEPFAAAKAAERMTAAQQTEIASRLAVMRAIALDAAKAKRKTISPSVIRRFEAADLAFHMLVIEAAGNRRIAKSVGDSHVLSRIFSAARHRYDLGVLQSTLSDHERIFAALVAKDAPAAAAAMREHILAGRDRTLAAVDAPADRWWQAR